MSDSNQNLKYGKFELPAHISVTEDKERANFATFVAQPFEPGYGHTIGSAMRRMITTSLEAPAIVSVRFQDVPHEYMSVDGIIEDMTNIILNLKGALLRKLPVEDEAQSRDMRVLTHVVEVTQEELDKNGGSKSVTLADLIDDGSFEIVNPNLHIFTATTPLKKQIDLKVAFGRGYVASERLDVPNRVVDEILIDACFSPARIVNYYVNNTRVGQDTDFDSLVIEVQTDGRVTPTEAVSFASQIGRSHFEVFDTIKKHTLKYIDSKDVAFSEDDELLGKLSLGINEIELSVRAANCFSGAKIDTIAELVMTPRTTLLNFKNLGKKSAEEIEEKLTGMGLSLGMDLAPYGITPENVKDKIAEYQQRVGAAEQFPAEEETL